MTQPMGGGEGIPQYRHLSVIKSVFAVGKGVVVVGRVDLNGIARMVRRDCDCVWLSGPRHFRRYRNRLLRLRCGVIVLLSHSQPCIFEVFLSNSTKEGNGRLAVGGWAAVERSDHLLL